MKAKFTITFDYEITPASNLEKPEERFYLLLNDLRENRFLVPTYLDKTYKISGELVDENARV